MYVHLLRGNRDLFVTALGGSSRAASGRPEAVADDERGKEVRLADSTCEAGEQSGTSRGGAGGGKQWDQEECETAKHGPNAESGSRVTGAGSHTWSCHRFAPRNLAGSEGGYGAALALSRPSQRSRSNGDAAHEVRLGSCRRMPASTSPGAPGQRSTHSLLQG